jgi:hypothetical protein
MKILNKIILLYITIWVTSLSADTTYSMEAFQCDFVNGKDYSDVQKVVPSWTKYADENFSQPYSAALLTPYLKSESEVDFDVAWVGFSGNQEQMGAIADDYLATSASIQAKWDRVVDCPTYGFYGVFEARSPSESFVEGENTYWAISSCSFKEGKQASDLANNDKGWNAFMSDQGFTGGVWRWWPSAGSPNNFEGDFLLNISYSTMAEMGIIQDARYAAQNAGELPESILNCDNPRVYIAENVRLENLTN